MAISVLFALYLRPGMYWTNSYWGGSLAASGGALVLLSIGISRERQSPLSGALFASGILLLFWTRPFEGGVFTLTILIVFARQIWRARSLAALLAATCVFVAGGVFTCCDNRAVTGSPFQLPHLLHDRQYATVPALWILPMRPEPTYAHPRLASQNGINGWEATQYIHHGSFLRALWTGFTDTLATLERPLLLALAFTILLPFAWRDRIFQKMTLVIVACLFVISLETFHFEHYAAPLWAPIALAIAVWAERVVSVERAYSLRTGKKPLALILVLAALYEPVILQIVIQTPQLWRNGVWIPGADKPDSQYLNNWSNYRSTLIKQLSSADRPQLVIVRYPSPDWNVGNEWVYNGADIDHQRVIFAHDLGAEEDKALLQYYHDRTALLLTFDRDTGYEHVQLYPSPTAPR